MPAQCTAILRLIDTSRSQQQQHAATRQKSCSVVSDQELTRYSASQGRPSSRAVAFTSLRSEWSYHRREAREADDGQ
jgi:hypothetical protein